MLLYSSIASEVTPDRTCHYTHDFEEILQASLKGLEEYKCIYCTDFVSESEDQIRNHLLRIHYTFSYNYMLDELCVCVLPCRRDCLPRPRHGKRSHFHCPTCARVYTRKPALCNHVETYKGHCVPLFLKGKQLGTGSEFQKRAIPHMKCQVKSLPPVGDDQGKNPEEESSYTIVVDQDSNLGGVSDEELPKIRRIHDSNTVHAVHYADSSLGGVSDGEPPKIRRIHENKFKHSSPPVSKSPVCEADADAAGHFGRTVSSRIRGLSKRKQAEAMQKIMQILFDIEYCDKDT